MIKDIQKFIQCIRPKHYSKNLIENGKFCKICFSYVKSVNYPRHYKQCKEFKGTPNIIIPQKGQKFKFTAIHALEKAPFVCYYDCESKLTDNKDIKNSEHRHEILSYKYIIVDVNDKVRAKRIETGGEKLSEKMLKKMMSDFKTVRNELEKDWTTYPILTEEDEKNFQEASICAVCKIDFNSKLKNRDIVKVRHHQWSRKIIYDGNKKSVEWKLCWSSLHSVQL